MSRVRGLQGNFTSLGVVSGRLATLGRSSSFDLGLDEGVEPNKTEEGGGFRSSATEKSQTPGQIEGRCRGIIGWGGRL